MKLLELQTGESAIIVKVKGHGAFRKRILEMGFVKGKKVTVIKNAPFKDPIEYEIMGYKISLRRSEAASINVLTEKEVKEHYKRSQKEHNKHHQGHENHSQNTTEGIDKFDMAPFFGTISDEVLHKAAIERGKVINVALVGNPNCGKTTLFNYASGSKERVGNYGGVTVESKQSSFTHNGYKFNIVDLPGTYSISAYSPEEICVREHILEEKPDIVVNIIDTSNIERNMFLTTQLIDMDIRVVGALNMFDEFKRKGDNFDYNKLGQMLGIDFVPTISSKHKGVGKLFDKLIETYEASISDNNRHVSINYGKTIERAIDELVKVFNEDVNIPKDISQRFLAIKLLEGDSEVTRKYVTNKQLKLVIEKVVKKIESEYGESSETVITDAKYGFISGALKETYKESSKTKVKNSETIDIVLTHKLWGFPIFLFFMWLMFQVTFTLGSYPQDWLDSGVSALMNFLGHVMPDGSFKSLLIDGIISGVGGVLSFLPNILILFFFISFMEDSGYMSRAAFIMDKPMHRMGLHGKSFIPLIMGFGCSVPAIMATKTIEDRNNRLLTMLISPFMSCSGRLPVYILFLGTFFPKHSGTLLFAIYCLGILVAVLVANIFKKVLFRENDAPFVMELPPYRLPTFRTTLKHMWNTGGQYFKKVGGIIMIASIVIWFLNAYPKNTPTKVKLEQQKLELVKNYQKDISGVPQGDLLTKLSSQYNDKMTSLDRRIGSEQQTNSYIGRMGRFIEPVLRPLGFDWRMGIAILTGVAAKEIVVSTMAVIYQTGSDGSHSTVKDNIKNAKNEDGSKVFSPLVIFSFLIFTLLYSPCIAAIAATKRESGSWKWAIFTITYTVSLAWILSFVFYQLGSLIF